MTERLQEGRLYLVRLRASRRARSALPHEFAARFLQRKPRRDYLHGNLIGWQAIFSRVNSVDGNSAIGIAEEDFTAEPLPEQDMAVLSLR